MGRRILAQVPKVAKGKFLFHYFTDKLSILEGIHFKVGGTWRKDLHKGIALLVP